MKYIFENKNMELETIVEMSIYNTNGQIDENERK